MAQNYLFSRLEDKLIAGGNPQPTVEDVHLLWLKEEGIDGEALKPGKRRRLINCMQFEYYAADEKLAEQGIEN